MCNMQIKTNGTHWDLSYICSNWLTSARVAWVQMRADLPLNICTTHNVTSLCLYSIKSRTCFWKIEQATDICNLIPAHVSSCFPPTSTCIHMQSKRIHQSDINSITKMRLQSPAPAGTLTCFRLESREYWGWTTAGETARGHCECSHAQY